MMAEVLSRVHEDGHGYDHEEDMLAMYDLEMEAHLAKAQKLGGVATAFEALARPIEAVQPIEAAEFTDPYTTGPDNRGNTQTDYGDVRPAPPPPPPQPR